MAVKSAGTKTMTDTKPQFAQRTKVVAPKDCDTIIAIDVANIAHRSYYGNKELKTLDGRESGHVYGSIKSILYYLGIAPGKKICLTFAYEGENSKQYRQAVVPGYKANRGEDRFRPTDDVEHLFRNIPGFHVKSPDMEGDDVLAWAAWNARHSEKDLIILSSDKDLWALMDDRIKIFSPYLERFVTQEDVWEQYMLTDPKKIYLAKAIFGDSSDNIKGVYRLLKKQVIGVIDLPDVTDIDTFRDFASRDPNCKANSLQKIDAVIPDLKKNLSIIVPNLKQEPKWFYTTNEPKNREQLEADLKSWDCYSLIDDMSGPVQANLNTLFDG